MIGFPALLFVGYLGQRFAPRGLVARASNYFVALQLCYTDDR